MLYLLIRVAREASYERSDQALLEGTHSIIIITLFKSEKCLFTVYKLLSFLLYFSFVPSTDLLSNMKEAAILSPLLVCRRGVQAVCQKYLIYAGKNNFSFCNLIRLTRHGLLGPARPT